MRLKKSSNILLLGLSLILSLVSFTGVTNNLPSEAIKTALVVSDYSDNKRFSISYQNAIKNNLSAFSKYSTQTFTEFQKDYNLKEITTFKAYTLKTLWLRAEQLHAKCFIISAHLTLYNDIV